MYRLSEFLTHVMGLDLAVVEGCEMCFFETDGERTMQVNRMRDTLDCYTFTLVFQGELTLLHGNHRLTLHRGDMYIYTPGGLSPLLLVSRGRCREMNLACPDFGKLERPLPVSGGCRDGQIWPVFGVFSG